MAKFCGNCGAEVEDDARVCGNCGVPLGGASSPKVDFKVPDKVKNADFKKIAVIVAVILAVIIIGSIAFNIVRNNTGYRAMLNRSFKAIQKADTEGLMKELSVFIEDSYGDDDLLEDDLDISINSYLDRLEDEVGAEPKISFEIKKASKLSDRKLKQLKDNLEDNDKDYDGDELQKAMHVDLKLKIKGPDDTSTDSINNMLIVKENGAWKVLSFNEMGMHYNY